MHQSIKHKLNFLKTFEYISAPYGPKICHFKMLVAPKKKKQAMLLVCYKKLEIMMISCTDVNTVSSRDHQRWSRGHKARGQGQGHKKNPRPRPRTAFPRTDTLVAKDRNARGQGQGPRTQVQVLSKKKRSSQKFFKRSPKKGLHKNFSSDLHKQTFSKNFFKRSTKF